MHKDIFHKSNLCLYFVLLLTTLKSFGQACHDQVVWANYTGENQYEDIGMSDLSENPIIIDNQKIWFENTFSGSSASILNDMIRSPRLGTIENVYTMALDGEKDDFIKLKITFDPQVYDLIFSLLDIDKNSENNWQDSVVVKAYNSGLVSNLTDLNITAISEDVQFNDELNSFSGLKNQSNTSSTNGNVGMYIPGPIDSVVITYHYGPLSNQLLGSQVIGISDISYTSYGACIKPSAKADLICSDYSPLIVIDPISNDSEGDNPIDYSSLKIITQGSKGFATVDHWCHKINYVPYPNQVGTDILVYAICDQNFLCDTGTIEINLFPQNSIFAVDDQVATNILDNAYGNVLSNDFDDQGDQIILDTVPISGPFNGTLILSSDGHFTYTPQKGYKGTDYFEYQICDDQINPSCDEAKVSINVVIPKMKNQNLVIATDDEFVSFKNQVITGQVLNNDDDLKNMSLFILNPQSINSVFPEIQMQADGNFQFTSPPDFDGNYLFDYTVCSSADSSLCDSAIVNIQVLSSHINCDEIFSVSFDDFKLSEISIPIEGNFINNDLKMLNLGFTIDLVPEVPPKHGSVTIFENGNYMYIPDPTYTGEDDFTYEICYLGGDIISSTKSYQNQSQINLPLWVNSIVSFIDVPDEGTVRSMSISNLSMFHHDVSELQFLLISPSNTVITLFGEKCAGTNDINISFDEGAASPITGCPLDEGNVYQAEESFSSFIGEQANGVWTLLVTDNKISTNTGILYGWDLNLTIDNQNTTFCRNATVNLMVSPFVEPPIAINDTSNAVTGEKTTIKVADNDKDLSGRLNKNSVKIIKPPSNGEVMVEDDFNIAYRSLQGYCCLDSFEYQICNEFELCDTATVYINLLPSLAVELLDFKAFLSEENYVNIEWKIFTDENVESYILERNEGLGYYHVASVDGKGKGITEYQYLDPVVSLSAGDIYYRLKWYDENGNVNYSPIEVVQIKKEFSFKIFPNPVSDLLYIQNPDFQQETLEGMLQVYDLNGRLIIEKSLQDTYLQHIVLSELDDGIYTILIRKGYQIISKKIVKL